MPNTTGDHAFWSRMDVSDISCCWLWRGAINGRGYGQVTIGGVVLVHRYVWELVHGPIPTGLVVDHTCFNRGCGNPHHLRTCTVRQNNENRSGRQRNNTSGFQGVVRKKMRSGNYRWWARVGWQDRRIHVGYFDTAEAAGEAARLRRLELYTHNLLDRQAGRDHGGG